MSLIFIFIDGIGLGSESETNPFTSKNLPAFKEITLGQSFSNKAKPVTVKERFFSPIDACLQTNGLPQSGTGQTTLFSGINAAKVLGRHFGPYPHSKIKSLLSKDSLFQKVIDQKRKPFFINAFPDKYVEFAKERNRWSCTTLMTLNSGLTLNSINDVLNERAITAELTQEIWKQNLNDHVPVIKEKETARRVIKAAEIYDLVLVEYYLTDKAGHERKPDFANNVLKRLDLFLCALFEDIKASEHTLLLTSDHGNLEDLSVKTHTYNKVPFFVTGKMTNVFRSVTSIIDVTPSIVKWFKSQETWPKPIVTGQNGTFVHNEQASITESNHNQLTAQKNQ